MRSRPSDDRSGGSVCVLDPAPYPEVTVERGTGGEAELHGHHVSTDIADSFA